MDPRMYYENRSKAVKALLESNSPNPYPHKFHVTYDDKQFVKDYEHIKVCMHLYPVVRPRRQVGKQAEADHVSLL